MEEFLVIGEMVGEKIELKCTQSQFILIQQMLGKNLEVVDKIPLKSEQETITGNTFMAW